MARSSEEQVPVGHEALRYELSFRDPYIRHEPVGCHFPDEEHLEWSNDKRIICADSDEEAIGKAKDELERGSVKCYGRVHKRQLIGLFRVEAKRIM